MSLWSYYFKQLLLPFITLVILGSLWVQSRNKWKQINTFPGPKPYPILGNLLEFPKHNCIILDTLMNLADKYKGFYRLWLGRSPVIVISQPNHLQTFYSNISMLDRADMYHKFREVVGENLFLSDGEKWKQFRKLFLKNFNSTPVDLLTMNIVESSTSLISELSSYADGSYFPIKMMLHIHTANSILNSALGEKIKRKDAEDLLKRSEKLLEIIYYRNFQPFHHFDFIFRWTQQNKILDETRKYTQKFVRDVVVKKKIDMESMKTINEEIPNLYIYKMLQDVPIDVVSSELETLFLAGLDTTSDTIGFTLLVLGLFPDIQQKVFEEDREFRTITSSRPPDSNDLQHYQYLERVIKESLRIFPVGPAIARKLGKDTAFGDYIVPKGVDVAALQIYTNRNPDIFVNPLIFDPDRFLPDNLKNIPPYAFNPFSAGPRGCPGQRYAYLLMKIYISAIVRNFKITSKYKNLEEAMANAEARFTLKDSNGYPLSLQKRNKEM